MPHTMIAHDNNYHNYVIEWSDWSEWSECSKDCEGGTRLRSRSCPPGIHCSGNNVDEERCNVNVTCGKYNPHVIFYHEF